MPRRKKEETAPITEEVKKPRRTRKKAVAAEPVPAIEEDAEVMEATPADESAPAAEEQPKKMRATRKKKAEGVPAPEEKPKRRGRRKKAETVEAAPVMKETDQVIAEILPEEIMPAPEDPQAPAIKEKANDIGNDLTNSQFRGMIKMIITMVKNDLPKEEILDCLTEMIK